MRGLPVHALARRSTALLSRLSLPSPSTRHPPTTAISSIPPFNHRNAHTFGWSSTYSPPPSRRFLRPAIYVPVLLLVAVGVGWEYFFGANRRFPPEARSALRKAVLYHKYSSDPQLAIRHYRAAHHALLTAHYSPTSPEVTGVLLQLGALYEQLGKPARAITVYEAVWDALVVQSEHDPAPRTPNTTKGVFWEEAYVGVTEPYESRMRKAVGVAVKISELCRIATAKAGKVGEVGGSGVGSGSGRMTADVAGRKTMDTDRDAARRVPEIEKAERYIGWAVRTLLGAQTGVEMTGGGGEGEGAGEGERGKGKMAMPVMVWAAEGGGEAGGVPVGPPTAASTTSSSPIPPSSHPPSTSSTSTPTPNPTSKPTPMAYNVPPERLVPPWSTPHQLSLVLESAAMLYAWDVSPRQLDVGYATMMHALRISEMYRADEGTHAVGEEGDEVCRQAWLMLALGEVADGIDRAGAGGKGGQSQGKAEVSEWWARAVEWTRRGWERADERKGKHKCEEVVGTALGNLGTLYESQTDYPTARSFYLRSISHAKTHGLVGVEEYAKAGMARIRAKEAAREARRRREREEGDGVRAAMGESGATGR